MVESVEILRKKENYEEILSNIGRAIEIGRDEGEKIKLITIADVEEEPVCWLWPNRVPLDSLTIIAGNAGVGKSYFTMMMAAYVSKGKSWPTDPNFPVEKGTVLVLASEDMIKNAIRPRVRVHDGDLTKVKVVEAVIERNGEERIFN